MKIVYAHEKPNSVPSQSIFLAGPSPRDEDHYDWRPTALEILENMGFRGNVFVPLPRDGQWAPNYDSQVEWELTYLEVASVIVFWIPRDLDTLPAFTTNVEFGMYVKSGKIILGFPKDAPKMRYLAYVGKKNSIPIFHSLEKTLRGAVEHA
ncbi:MAG: hypothetical protein BMS9Abin13_383 [Patescibacteria group bacterium]|nr:MAG: hypothetical protein BMS9Abin13_383 [Patescibacteria group bacterium]